MPGSLTLQELLIFNDELAGLVRAGVPLPQGLKRFSLDFPGRLGSLGTRIQERMESGKTLGDALGAEGANLPRAYHQIVGIAELTGTLSTALESISTAAKNLQALRRGLGRAMWYPLLVTIYAYAMILLFLTHGWERYRILADDLGTTTKWSRSYWLDALTNSVGYWGWIPPAVVVCAVILSWFFRSGDLLTLAGGVWVPGSHRLERSWRAVQFTKMLAVLVRLGVPLVTAIDRAADLAGDRQMQQEAAQLTSALRSGDPRGATTSRSRGRIPGLVKWWLFQETTTAGLAEGLECVADGVQEHTLLMAERMRFLFPILATVLIGGGTALAYGWLMATAMRDLWEGLLMKL